MRVWLAALVVALVAVVLALAPFGIDDGAPVADVPGSGPRPHAENPAALASPGHAEEHRVRSPRRVAPGTGTASSTGEGSPPTLQFVGHVTDLEGGPIAGAELQSVSNPGFVLARTDAEGRFVDARPSSDGKAPRTAHPTLLVVRAAGHADEVVSVPTIEVGVCELGTIRLSPGGSVHGRVLGTDGKPVQGVRVAWIPLDPTLPTDLPWEERRLLGLSMEWSGTTTADGTYDILGVPAGRGLVHAWRGAARADGREMELAPAARLEVDVSLPWSGSRLSGRVVLPNGEAAPHARVYVQRGGIHTSDAAGRFDVSVDDARPMAVYARAQGDDLRPSRRVQVRPGEEVELVLRTAPVVEVRLVAPGRRPVSPGTLAVQGGGEYPVDGKGAARIPLPLGNLVVEARAPGFHTETFGPFVPWKVESRGKPLVLAMEPGPAARGQVVHGREPVEGARVVACEAHAPGGAWSSGPPGPLHGRSFRVVGRDDPDRVAATTDAEGRYAASIGDSPWIGLRVDALGFPPSWFGPFPRARTRSTEGWLLRLEPEGSIEGRLIPPAGEGAADRIVGASNGWGQVFTARTDANGRFRIDGLQPGPWQLRECTPPVARRTALRGSSREAGPPVWDCTVAAGNTTFHDLDLRAKGSCILAGRIPLDGPCEALLYSTHLPHVLQGPVVARTRANEDGSFELRVGRPGTYLLLLNGIGWNLAEAVELERGSLAWEAGLSFGRVRIDGAAPLWGVHLIRSRTDRTSVWLAAVPPGESCPYPIGPGNLVHQKAGVGPLEARILLDRGFRVGKKLHVREGQETLVVLD